jgi:hypothetical protein
MSADRIVLRLGALALVLKRVGWRRIASGRGLAEEGEDPDKWIK